MAVWAMRFACGQANGKAMTIRTPALDLEVK